MCLVVFLSSCESDAPQWSSCEEARAKASFVELPPTEVAEPLEVGDELPRLRWGSGVTDAETLATQALALACVLTNDEVKAGPELLRWAQTRVDAEMGGSAALFDRGLVVELYWSGPHAGLSVSRDVSSEAELNAESAAENAINGIEALLEVAGIEAESDALVFHHLREVVVDLNGGSEATTHLAGVSWGPRVGRVHVGLPRFEARVEENGHLSEVAVPLGRLYDDGERGTAEVAEADADALFVEKAAEGLSLEGWMIQSLEGNLTFPVAEDGGVVELSWVGSYVVVHDDGPSGRRVPFFMSLSDAEAPLSLSPLE